MKLKRWISIGLGLILALSLAACGYAEGFGGPGGPGGFGGPGGPGGNVEYYSVSSEPVVIDEGKTYTVTLTLEDPAAYRWDVEDGADVTDWFVQENGEAAFEGEAAATAAVLQDGQTLEITLDAAAITGFGFNGPASISVSPASDAIVAVSGPAGFMRIQAKEVGTVEIPAISAEGEVYGSGFSNGMSTVVSELGEGMVYTEGATLVLSLDGLDSSLIDSSAAVVSIADGDGYFVSDYELTNTQVTGEWTDGKLTYMLSTGDLIWSVEGYTEGMLRDGEALSWSCFGGDGSGNYYLNLKVSGITYNGLPVADQIVKLHLYAYGRSATDLAVMNFGTLSPSWSWDGEGEKPILCDAYEDDFTIQWPAGIDASALKAEDISVVLSSGYGDELVLEPGKDFVLNLAAAGKTELAVRYQHWAFTPVYSTMTIRVDSANLAYDSENYSLGNLEQTYDIASVYAYSIQSGGSMEIDHGVTFTYYGVKLDSWEQVQIPIVYRLTAAGEDGSVQYYAENESGEGYLTADIGEAKVYDGTGADDYNYQLYDGHMVVMTLRYGQTEDKTVDGQNVVLSKVYASGMPDLVTISVDPYGSIEPVNPEIETLPGFVLGETWLTHGMWPWLPAFGAGWVEGAE